MNQFVPDWSRNMGDAFAPLGGEDDGLMELLWCNGHVVMQSQAPPRKPPRPERAVGVRDDEAAAWFQYPLVEDPLERDLFSEFFGETAAGAGKDCKQEECMSVAVTAALMPLPWEKTSSGDVGVSDGAVADTAGGEGTAAGTEIDESSALTVGSSFCGSNHVQTPLAHIPSDGAPPPGSGEAGSGAGGRDAATVTSSSLRPSSCDVKAGQPGAAAHRSADKRKQREDDATQCDDASQDVEFESAAVMCEQARKPTTGKRRRAAEVHNLSERRRRDRINEKMKALQELIPHCNKTDKASMLDEAIEYLKSLQLQLQMMWMGGGIAAAAAPVMFPSGVHQYMQRMASMPMMPFMAAPAAVQSPPGGHHMPVADPYGRRLAGDHQQPPSPTHYMQGMMSLYQQQSPAPPPVAPGGSVPAATAPTLPSDSILHKKYETCGKPEIRGINS